MKITVEVLPSLKTNPNMVASATVSIETDSALFHIHDCRLLQNKNGIVWFSFPTFSLQQPGTRQFEYRPTVEVPHALMQQVTAEAIRAYEVWKQQQAVRP